MALGRKISVVILAAGEGTRMKSDTPKVLFPLCGRPMVDYVSMPPPVSIPRKS